MVYRNEKGTKKRKQNFIFNFVSPQVKISLYQNFPQKILMTRRRSKCPDDTIVEVGYYKRLSHRSSHNDDYGNAPTTTPLWNK